MRTILDNHKEFSTIQGKACYELRKDINGVSKEITNLLGSKVDRPTIKLSDDDDFTDTFARKLKEFTEKKGLVDRLEEEVNNLINDQKSKLHRISGLNEEEAKNLLFESLINKVKLESAQKLQEVREQTKIEANKISKNIVIQAIQRSAVSIAARPQVGAAAAWAALGARLAASAAAEPLRAGAVPQVTSAHGPTGLARARVA